MKSQSGRERETAGRSGPFGEVDALATRDANGLGEIEDGEVRRRLPRAGGFRLRRPSPRRRWGQRPRPRPAARGRRRPGARFSAARRRRRSGPRRFRPRRRRMIVVGRRAPEAPPPEQGTEYMRWVQNGLNQILGRQLPVNGIAGPETRAAIREFQRSQGLPVSGMVGPKTEQALTAALSEKQPQPGPDEGNGAPPEQTGSELELVEGEWQREVNRRSRLYIRWVQQGLNKILGLRLAEDGILGPLTRSGVRNFQQKYNLAVDGIVGPQTERALVAAGAGSPPGSAPVAYPPQAPVPSPAGGHGLRNRIVQIAVQEWQRWGQGAIQECDPTIRPVLEDYWRTGVGWLPSQSNYCGSVAWSAAFISWVMRQAGAGSAFHYSSAHTDYVGAAKRNRLANSNNPFKTYRISEIAPRVGDLVCLERSNSGVTYDNVDQGFRSSHCDIVVAVQPGQITTIGGNLSDSVQQNRVPTDAGGHIARAGYYAIVRVEG
jgi:peptidoglycan hydrolase-like protein with peptidoglycan-binding domain